MKKITFSFFVCCSLLLANNNNTNNEEEQKRMMLNATFMDLAKEENVKVFRDVRDRKDFVENEFLNLNEIEISNVPEIKSSSDTITLTMHPEFPRTVLFDNAKITNLSAYPSDAINVFMDENNLNSLEIKTNNSFKKGVAVVKYLDKNNNKKVQNIFIESYNSKKNSKIYLTTNIKSIKYISPVDILKAFQKLKGTTPKNGNSIVIDNVAYRFIEDKINGNITIVNKKFRIEQTFSKD